MKSLACFASIAVLLPMSEVAGQGALPSVVEAALPSRFALRENRGQWPSALAFQAHQGPATAWLHDGGLILELVQRAPVPSTGEEGLGGVQGRPLYREVGRASLRLGVARARATKPEPEDALPGVLHFVREERAQCARDVRSFERAVYREVVEGVDLVFRTQGSALAYEFHMEGGASSDDLEMILEGAEQLSIGGDGSLEIRTSCGLVRQSAPRSFERAEDGRWISVPSRFELRASNRYGFAVERRDPSRELLIDPVFDWSTFLGGSADEYCGAIEPVAGDRVVVCGISSSPQLPAPWSTNAGSGLFDGYIAVVDTAPAGAGAIWCTLLGGSAADLAFDVAYDPTTDLVSVVGLTASANFPIRGNAYDSVLGGTYDAFLTQLDATGAPVYSSYFGAGGIDRFTSVEARNGRLTIGGYTSSGQFPIGSGAPFQPNRAGGHDIVLLRLDPAAPLPVANQIVAGTFLGSVLDEGTWATPGTTWWGNLDLQEIYIAADDSVWIASQSRGDLYPTTAATAFQRFYYSAGVNGDLVISHLDATLSQNLYSTYLGSQRDDATWNLHVEEPGTITVAAICWGSGFPTTAGALSSTYSNARNDFVVARLDTTRMPPPQQLLYSTYVSGDSYDEPGGLAVEPSSGIAIVTGGSESTNLPFTSGAYQSTYPGVYSAFAMRLELSNTPARDVHYCSYFASPSATYSSLWLNAIRPDGRLAVVGEARDSGFPVTAGAPQTTLAGATDALVLVMDLLPSGATRLGASSPACSPPSHLQISSAPSAGNANFEILGAGLPTSAPLLLAIGPAYPPGIPISLGAVLYVSFPFLVTLPVASDARGFVRVPLPIPPGVQLPSSVATQLLHLVPNACGGFVLGSSDALVF